MEIRAHHRIEFEIEGSDDSLPPIPYPSYLYRVGERFKYYDALKENLDKEILGIFEVTKIEQELHDVAVGEQVIVVHVRKIQEK